MSWLAPIAGAVIGGMMSDDGGTTTQKADPWEGVQPALRELYASSLQNYQSGGPQYYPGSTVAPQSTVTQQAQQGIYSLAANKSPVLDAGQQQAYSTARGDYLNANPASQPLYNIGGRDFMQSSPAMWDLYDTTAQDFMGTNSGTRGLEQTGSGAYLNANPYLDSMFGKASNAVGRQFANNVMPGIASMFSGGGRFGSNQMAEGLGQAEQQYGNTLNDLATQIYGGNYAAERGLQQQAQNSLGQFGLNAQGQRQSALANIGQLGLAGQGQQIQALGELGTQFSRERALQQGAAQMSPMLDQADYYGYQQGAQVGAQQDLYNQQLVQADFDRYMYGQNQPTTNLQTLSGLLNGYPVGQSTTQSGNPLMGAAGGAMMANKLFGGGGGDTYESLTAPGSMYSMMSDFYS